MLNIFFRNFKYYFLIIFTNKIFKSNLFIYKMKPRLQILLIYMVLSIIDLSFQKICGKEDIGKIIFDCDHQSQRESNKFR
jgi:hypothetical protein